MRSPCCGHATPGFGWGAGSGFGAGLGVVMVLDAMFDAMFCFSSSGFVTDCFVRNINFVGTNCYCQETEEMASGHKFVGKRQRR